MEDKMGDYTEIVTLQEIYQKMDTEGRKKMATSAAQLLKVQKTLNDKPNAAIPQEHVLRKERHNSGHY